MTRLAQHHESMKRYNARKRVGPVLPAKGGPSNARYTVASTIGSLRRSSIGNDAPTYEARYDDDTKQRASFFQLPGKSWDFARARTVARRLYPDKQLVNGVVEHTRDGKIWRVPDNMESTTKTTKRVAYKTLLENIVAAVHADDVAILETAWNEA